MHATQIMRWVVASAIVVSWPVMSQAQTAQETPTDQPVPAAQAAPTAQPAEPAASTEGTTAQEQSLDKDASTSDGQARVTQRLAQEFGVPESQVTDLRAKKLGYGEIHHALSLAQQMPGGITQDNVNQVLTMRQEQHMGWGKISQQLNTKLGPAGNRGAQPSTTPSATSQPQPVTKPGRGAESPESSGGVRGNRSNAPGNTPLGGGFGAGAAHGSVGGQRGNSGAAPGHNR